MRPFLKDNDGLVLFYNYMVCIRSVYHLHLRAVFTHSRDTWLNVESRPIKSKPVAVSPRSFTLDLVSAANLDQLTGIY
jgi:hypothetical protein